MQEEFQTTVRTIVRFRLIVPLNKLVIVDRVPIMLTLIIQMILLQSSWIGVGRWGCTSNPCWCNAPVV